MKKFELGKNTLNIELSGCVFNTDPALVEVSMGAAQKIIDNFNEKVNNGTADKTTIEEAISGLIEKVETALENGAIKKILSGNTVSLHDMCDIVIYIKACARDFERKKGEEYKQYSQNREQRRSGGKR